MRALTSGRLADGGSNGSQLCFQKGRFLIFLEASCVIQVLFQTHSLAPALATYSRAVCPASLFNAVHAWSLVSGEARSSTGTFSSIQKRKHKALFCARNSSILKGGPEIKTMEEMEGKGSGSGISKLQILALCV